MREPISENIVSPSVVGPSVVTSRRRTAGKAGPPAEGLHLSRLVIQKVSSGPPGRIASYHRPRPERSDRGAARRTSRQLDVPAHRRAPIAGPRSPVPQALEGLPRQPAGSGTKFRQFGRRGGISGRFRVRGVSPERNGEAPRASGYRHGIVMRRSEARSPAQAGRRRGLVDHLRQLLPCVHAFCSGDDSIPGMWRPCVTPV